MSTKSYFKHVMWDVVRFFHLDDDIRRVRIPLRRNASRDKLIPIQVAVKKFNKAKVWKILTSTFDAV